MSTLPANMSGAAATAPPGVQEPRTGYHHHENEIENREAHEFWGYLFKPDKTGTDKLRSLLSGLKEVMNTNNERSDNPDLTPNQLAHFYRELHGNYDQLFLGTPSESIAFIYKSLGCLHSLQPLSHSKAFTDPTVPALKTEGWIMWQTIQLLLGPEEHSSFLMEAVQKWDVIDPSTGEVFPKILPRQCFPLEPDKHMAAWYEGVSERLRREAEDEERQREMEAEQAEVRRLREKREDPDDEASIDSKGPALAYFRNPLYRHVDGRPTIVRRNSKRPQLSPRPTSMMGRGKEAAATMGHVFRNIGSPHLWDGRSGSTNQGRDRDRDHDRRTSLPDNRYPPELPPASGFDSKLSPGYSRLHQRRRSAQLDRPDTGSSEESWEREDGTPAVSPMPGSHHHHHRDNLDVPVGRSRSHEPTPSQRDYPDYFHGYDDPSQRRNSAYNEAGTPPSSNGIGPAFGPSQSPLFASHVAKQPQAQPRMQNPEQYSPPRKSMSVRRAQGRPYSQSPDPSVRSRDRDDRDLRRSRFEQSPASNYEDARTGTPPVHQPGFPPLGGAPGDSGRSSSGAPPGSGGYPPPESMSGREKRNGRAGGSEISGYSGAEDRNGRNSRQKHTRFAAGVDGRRYPNETPWR